VTHRGQSLLASGAAARLILPHLARPYNSRLLAQRDAASLGIDIAIVAYVEHSHCHPHRRIALMRAVTGRKLAMKSAIQRQLECRGQ
jgi:hypothetical protein